jgi:hypothetical protein
MLVRTILRFLFLTAFAMLLGPNRNSSWVIPFPPIEIGRGREGA